MRIAIDARKIADFGIGTYIRGLLRGLGELAAGDHYLALAPPGAELPPDVEHVVVEAPHYSLRELFVVGRAAERAGADLLHAPHYVVPMTSLPVTVTIHDLIHLHQPMRNPLAPLYARQMLRRAVRRAARVFTVSGTVRLDLERELGARNVVVTPNGVDSPRGPRRPEDPPLFLFVGNDKPHKNVKTLLAAFDRVRRRIPDARLILVGGAFQSLEVPGGVERPGFVPAPALEELYLTATALVMPSLEEGFGLPAAEAMAHGLPVVTSTAAALVEVTGDAALHAGAEDAPALAASMLRIAEDRALAASLGERGRARAAVLTWRRCAGITRAAWLETLR